MTNPLHGAPMWPGGPDGPGGLGAFVGRVAERSTLDQAWEAASAGRRTVVFLDGQPGFGKTALVADLLSRLTVGRLWRATAEADEASIPFGVLGQLVRGHGELPALLTAIAAGGQVDGDPLAVGLELLSVLDDLGGDDLALVVDDAQWADPQSLRALVFALRRLSEAPVLALLTCRSEAVGSLPPSLGRLIAEDSVRMTAQPFTSAEVRELARALGVGELAGRTAQRVAEHAGGSPLHVRAILGELADMGVTPDPDRLLPVPTSYARLVEARLEKLAPAAADLVAAVAVMTAPRPLALVGAVAGLAEPFAALDAAVAAGLLQRPGPDLTPRMAHPLTRAAIYQAIPAARRALLHRRACEQLAPIDDSAALRHRIAAADGVDETLAATVAKRAQADLARGARTSAVAWLRAAVRLSPPAGADRYLLQLVETLVLEADVAAEPSLRAELEARPTTALREYLLARLRTLVGDLPGARRLAAAAWQLARTEPGAAAGDDLDLTARIAAELARTSLTSGHAAEAITWAGQALSAARADPSVAVDMPGTQLLATAMQGHFDTALAAVAGLPMVITEPTPAQLDVMIARGMLSLWSGRLDQASADLTTVVRVTRRDGPIHLNLGASAYLADVAYRLGDWDTAITEAETGLALALDLDHVRVLPMLHAAAAIPYASRGLFEPAAEHVAEALRTAELVGDMQTLLWSRVAAGRLARARRDPVAVVAALAPLAASTDLDGVREPGVQPWQCLYAAALADVGRGDEAEQALDEAAQLAEDRSQPVEQLAAERTRAQLAAKQGRISDARAIMRAARPSYEAAREHPFELAEFDLVLGVVARQGGDHHQAVDALRRAHRTFERLQAGPWTREAASELRRCGLPGQPRPERRQPSRLTAREAAVVTLVASGMTNREIATHIAVSVKTVEYHLSNIFMKLGVRSRTQLAIWHAGLPGTPSSDARTGGP